MRFILTAAMLLTLLVVVIVVQDAESASKVLKNLRDVPKIVASGVNKHMQTKPPPKPSAKEDDKKKGKGR
jgi:hypothetical protein